MGPREYIDAQYTTITEAVKKFVEKCYQDDSYLLKLNIYSPENWQKIYQLLRNNKELLTDVSILFNTELLSLLQEGKRDTFDLGRISIEDWEGKHKIMCYHHVKDPRMTIIYHEKPGFNSLRAENNVLIMCNKHSLQESPPNKPLINHETSPIVLFHYYMLLKLSEILPFPEELIREELTRYFSTNTIGAGKHTIVKFNLQHTTPDGLELEPQEPHVKDYEGDNDDDIATIGRKYNIQLYFAGYIYH